MKVSAIQARPKITMMAETPALSTEDSSAFFTFGRQITSNQESSCEHGHLKEGTHTDDLSGVRSTDFGEETGNHCEDDAEDEDDGRPTPS